MRVVNKNPPRPPQRQHLYDKILDGQQWELVRGEDYQCTTKAMRNQLYTASTRRGGGAHIEDVTFDDGREGLHVTFLAKEAKSA